MSKSRNRQAGAGGKNGARQSAAGRPASARPNTQTMDKRQLPVGSRPAAGKGAGRQQAGGMPAGARPAGSRQAAGRPAAPPGGNGGPPGGSGGKAVRFRTRAASQEPAAARALPPPAPRWLTLATLVLSVIGLGISVYLTIEHVTGSIPICSSKGIINCAAVTTSAESKVFGIFPVSELGLAFYVFMVAVNSPWGWRRTEPAIRWLRLASVVVGIGFVLYLVYVELIQIGNICLWCTGVHIVTFFLFALIVFDTVYRQPPATSVPAVNAKKLKG